MNMDDIASKRDIFNLHNMMEAIFRSQTIQMTQQKCTHSNIQNILVKNNQNRAVMTNEMFTEEYSLRLPYEKIEKFLDFDKSLRTNKNPRKDLVIIILLLMFFETL